jgi:hypothetical protein
VAACRPNTKSQGSQDPHTADAQRHNTPFTGLSVTSRAVISRRPQAGSSFLALAAGAHASGRRGSDRGHGARKPHRTPRQRADRRSRRAPTLGPNKPWDRPLSGKTRARGSRGVTTRGGRISTPAGSRSAGRRFARETRALDHVGHGRLAVRASADGVDHPECERRGLLGVHLLAPGGTAGSLVHVRRSQLPRVCLAFGAIRNRRGERPPTRPPAPRTSRAEYTNAPETAKYEKRHMWPLQHSNGEELVRNLTGTRVSGCRQRCSSTEPARVSTAAARVGACPRRPWPVDDAIYPDGLTGWPGPLGHIGSRTQPSTQPLTGTACSAMFSMQDRRRRIPPAQEPNPTRL